jgi:LemA protein
MESAISRLLVVVEQYPNLKSNENFTRLMDELAGAENRLSVERMRYNDAVKVYNIRIRSFPANVFSGMFGFIKKNLLQAPTAAKETPTVSFQ